MSHPDPARPHEHEEVEKSKVRTAHAEHVEPEKGPHDPKEINPKMSSDIHYWAKEFGVTGDQLHEAIPRAWHACGEGSRGFESS